MSLTCQQLTKRYAGQVVLDRLDWRIEAGQTWGLVGPSGAGKTTLLRLLAGLERPDSGTIRDPAATGRSGRRRAIGMVFQNLGLWPHLTAAQHIACVLRSDARRDPSALVSQILAEVRLPPETWQKRPEQLSGGALQRLAIARALAIEPELLLLDEPLAQVDTLLRDELLGLLRDVAATRRVTAVYVTHSWWEASQFASHVGVLVDGRMLQAGECSQVYRHPVSALVARLTGPIVEIPGPIAREGRLEVAARATPLEDGGLVIRPQQLELTSVSQNNRWAVISCQCSGPAWTVKFQAAGHQLVAPMGRELQPGDVVGLRIKAW